MELEERIHNSSSFYNRSLYADQSVQPATQQALEVQVARLHTWADQIYCHSSEDMYMIPDNGIALAFTSPPYNVGKDYDNDMGFKEYLDLVRRVAVEVHRVLKPGGRYIINVANLGRRPYIPLHRYFYDVHMDVGFLPMGEIIWQKARGASASCAWGSWKSAKSPRLRDIHEYLLVFAKQSFSRPDSGTSDIGRDEFLDATLSIWEIPPESAKKVGHPAPFPVELAERVIKLYSYVDDVVLDPFVGSGSTCIAAVRTKRHYVGFDISEEYCELAESSIAEAHELSLTGNHAIPRRTSMARSKPRALSSQLPLGFWASIVPWIYPMLRWKACLKELFRRSSMPDFKRNS